MTTEPGDPHWLPVPDAPNYEASADGRVRSLDRQIVTSHGVTRRYRGRELAQSDANGYPSVRLGGGTPMRKVCVLVLLTFDGPCPPGQECLHRNGDKRDSAWSNLHWGTRSRNALDAVEHGVHPQACKDCCPLGHELREPNLVASKLAVGWRECLACARARPRVAELRRAGRPAVMREVAAVKYAKIMEAA